ncbi:DNA polymerase Y family protein [Psychromicrobium xiongbiense]|uniref:DNA polymerase Y family protein n=1 Tax=Psychromicrobium xiongbiense TaxID=3051184 RepID=UPI0025549AE2|nr:DNA polymerase Y family protein [Psychromicrobium sp. YIM S02556]
MTTERVMVLWCPDWPIVAAQTEYDVPSDLPVALIHRGMVFACSGKAREHGVRRGLRQREAQSRCPSLQIFPYDPAVDERGFEPVIAAVEQVIPGVQTIRPGTCVVRAQGPARYFGGEREAAHMLLHSAEELSGSIARVGVADGIFAAEQAARLAQDIRIIAPEASPAFLASLRLDVLQQPELTLVLEQLGLRTLGDFAALEQISVRERFGADGAQAHLLARGLDRRPVLPRAPVTPFDVTVDFEPSVERVDQLAFAVKTSAERFIDQLSREGKVCTALRVHLADDSYQHQEKVWKHPRFFDAEDVLDRIRWQIQGAGISEGEVEGSQQLCAGIVRVRIIPETVDDVAHHARGLWGNGPREHIHHGLARVQSMLGHTAVLTAALTGGRLLARRRALIPWGDSGPASESEMKRLHERPWPGALSGPAPATVFAEPVPVQLLDQHRRSVEVDDRMELSGVPQIFNPDSTPGGQRTVEKWAGPWPVEERWWEKGSGRVHRFQIVDGSGEAWVLMTRNGAWYAEAHDD